MLRFLLLLLVVLRGRFSFSSARHLPYAMRISCGARVDVRTEPTNTRWHKDFAYTGGVPANATLTSYITPPLKTLRYFPLSGGPEHCYVIKKVPKGHYSVRVFFGLVKLPNFDDEPLFDVSVEGTQIFSLKSGWSGKDDESFAEAIVFLMNGSASICFHSTGHGAPAILSIEILQVAHRAYYFGHPWGQTVILTTATRLTCGGGKPKFDADYSGDQWGGDRFWNPISTFGQNSDRKISVEKRINQTSNPPNFYPEGLYQSALVSTDSDPDLTYMMDVDPNKNYSVWLHFAEIDNSVNAIGKRVFDILINGDVVFEDVDIIKRTGGQYTALVLNMTAEVNGRSLTITFHPKEGSHAIINAIEVFEIIEAEAKTSQPEVRALQSLKKALGLPHRLGWNGDPCVPQQHPWSGADCQFDQASSKWIIDGLALDNQGLSGFLPSEISGLSNLQSINLSGNSLHGGIPFSIGQVSGLEVLDLSYNLLNGSIPESLGQLTSLRILNLNGNYLSGRVPATLGARLLHRASFNFTDNKGLCGMPGLPKCGHHLSTGLKIGIAFGVLLTFLLIVVCSICCWKRRQNIIRAQNAARDAPYAKARTQLSRDIQMTMHHNSHGHVKPTSENGRLLPSLNS